MNWESWFLRLPGFYDHKITISYHGTELNVCWLLWTGCIHSLKWQEEFVELSILYLALEMHRWRQKRCPHVSWSILGKTVIFTKNNKQTNNSTLWNILLQDKGEILENRWTMWLFPSSGRVRGDTIHDELWRMSKKIQGHSRQRKERNKGVDAIKCVFLTPIWGAPPFVFIVVMIQCTKLEVV